MKQKGKNQVLKNDMSKASSNKVDDKHERDLLNVINWQELLVFNLAKTFVQEFFSKDIMSTNSSTVLGGGNKSLTR